ncbi:hypothetical protein RJJ65_07085 [Rhizobium hidalgonense]|uniref:Uncharacterized protein n=1 Tax=Rhizobium hidalgonense TaxID=1538159 RepID=A0AAJ2GQS1_9HYPH|nr:hypothetical protein [Rhizobium hidalgonense]MDR9772420.1 hypothetical protein [Rhizobium hidalgonense]
MSFIDTHTGMPAGYTARSATWTTNSQAELLNDLCSGKEAKFTRFTWLSRKYRETFMEGCTQAFYVVKDYAETLLFEKLTDAERGVMLTIQRKTLRYNKLMETISRKTFYLGHCERDGTLKLNAMGNVMLPPGVANCSAVSKGVNGLLAKGLISRMECSHADRQEKVYSAGHLEVIVPRFANEAIGYLYEKIGDCPEARVIHEGLCRELATTFAFVAQENSF